MTQNKKKGIAKKALSISLVAAMLATSNAPVWASGFETVDPAAEGFTLEEVVETVDDFDASADMQAASEYTVETNTELTTVDGSWNSKLSFGLKEGETGSANLTVYKGADAVEVNRLEVYYNGGYLDQASVAAPGGCTEINATLSTFAIPGKDIYLDGGNVTVKLYVANERDAVAAFNYKLKPVDLENTSITAITSSKNYNGKAQYPNFRVGTAEFTNGEVIPVFNGVDEAKNVGGYTYRAQGVEEKGYTGYAQGTGGFAITAVAPNATSGQENLKVELSGEYTYNGKIISPKVVVTDLLSGEVLPEEAYTINSMVSPTTVGTYSMNAVGNEIDLTAADKYVGITFNSTYTIGEGTNAKTFNNNFSGGANSSASKTLFSGSYTVKALDLARLTDNYTLEMPAMTAAEIGGLTANQLPAELVIVDKKTGKELTAAEKANLIPVGTGADEVTVAAAVTDNKGTLTLAAVAGSTNVINSLTLNIPVAASRVVKADISVPANTMIGTTKIPTKSGLDTVDTTIQNVLDATEYTGSPVEPLKDVFSNLVWTAQIGGVDVKLDLGKDYTITYKENKDSNYVSKKSAEVILTFIGERTGEIKYSFNIKRANVTVTAKPLPYVAGKDVYEADVEVTTGSGSTKADVPASEYVKEIVTTGSKKGDTATTKVTFTNKNYAIDSADAGTDDLVKTVTATVGSKSLNADSVTAAVKGEYSYTGKAIDPEIEVKDGDTILKEGTDYKIVNKLGLYAGEASVSIEGMGNYEGLLTLKYEIAKADLKDFVAVTATTDPTTNAFIYDRVYDGTVLAPVVIGYQLNKVAITLDPYSASAKTGDIIIEADKTAKNVGEYTYVIKAADSSNKVQGTLEIPYRITAAQLPAKFVNAMDTANAAVTAADEDADYTGEAITLDVFKKKYIVKASATQLGFTTNDTLKEGVDYELVYENNVDAGKAYARVYGLGNFAQYDADGKKIPAASLSYNIVGKGIISQTDIKEINDVEYAGGMTVAPQVTVKKGEVTLVQGVDYIVKTDIKEVGSYTGAVVTIVGKGAYTTTDKNNTEIKGTATQKWNVVKKDLKNTTVVVRKGSVTVYNGSVIVPENEYTVVKNEDGSLTVKANASSKNYAGEQIVEGAAIPDATTLKVTDRTTSTVSLAWDAVEGAEGYTIWFRSEYDDKVSRKIVNGGDVTSWTQRGLQPGTKYFYTVRAWVKDADGNYVFGEQSPVQRGTTKPLAATIKSVSAANGKVKVTLTGEAAGAEMYSMCYSKGGSKFNEGNFKVGIRTSYTSRTFTKALSKGTYYVRVKSYRDLGNNKKVYGAWSNTMKVVVK